MKAELPAVIQSYSEQTNVAYYCLRPYAHTFKENGFFRSHGSWYYQRHCN